MIGGDVAQQQRPELIDVGPTHVLTAMQMRRVIDPEAGPALEMELRDDVVNPHGSLHGGLMGALIECGAAGCAVGGLPGHPHGASLHRGAVRCHRCGRQSQTGRLGHPVLRATRYVTIEPDLSAPSFGSQSERTVSAAR